MIVFQEVIQNKVPLLAKLASSIWHEFWKGRLTDSQIDYMVEKFQSETAIIKQLKDENYTYYLIKSGEDYAGYFGVARREDYLFLSKLYIKKEYRGKGIGRETFEKIKTIAFQDFDKIILTVNKYNEGTIAAYKKWGFKTVDTAVTDIGSGFVMDDYIMEYNK